MSNAPKFPQSQEDIAEDAMQSVGKAARGVWDFLTAPDDKEFLRRVDERHGTNLGELHARIKAGPGGDPALERAIDRVNRPHDCIHTPPCVGARCTVYEAAAAEGEVVIVVEDDVPKVCAFCTGKQVIQLKGTTRTPIACPTCKKNPSAKPKRLAK